MNEAFNKNNPPINGPFFFAMFHYRSVAITGHFRNGKNYVWEVPRNCWAYFFGLFFREYPCNIYQEPEIPIEARQKGGVSSITKCEIQTPLFHLPLWEACEI